MKINVEQHLKTFDGENLTEPTPDGPRDITLKIVCVNALLAQNPQEQLPGTEKVTRYELAKKIHLGKDVELSAEEITLAKKCVGEAFGAIIVGQTFEILEKSNG